MVNHILVIREWPLLMQVLLTVGTINMGRQQWSSLPRPNHLLRLKYLLLHTRHPNTQCSQHTNNSYNNHRLINFTVRQSIAKPMHTRQPRPLPKQSILFTKPRHHHHHHHHQLTQHTNPSTQLILRTRPSQLLPKQQRIQSTRPNLRFRAQHKHLKRIQYIKPSRQPHNKHSLNSPHNNNHPHNNLHHPHHKPTKRMGHR